MRFWVMPLGQQVGDLPALLGPAIAQVDEQPEVGLRVVGGDGVGGRRPRSGRGPDFARSTASRARTNTAPRAARMSAGRGVSIAPDAEADAPASVAQQLRG